MLWEENPNKDDELTDKVCQLLFSFSSINKTDRDDITEILLKVALSTTSPL
jgi:chorismate mutase